ncbi:MAG: GIY-YIG nuclease family protein [Fidelibacterota bacterium]
MIYVYVLKSQVDHFHYIGQTQSLSDRLRAHNNGKVRSTKAHRPYSLIYTEIFHSRSEAIKRETYLKHGKGNQWLREFLTEKGLW